MNKKEWNWREEIKTRLLYALPDVDITIAVNSIEDLISVALSKQKSEIENKVRKTIEELKFEEAPPFSANDTFRVQAELINKHLMPHIKEYILALLESK